MDQEQSPFDSQSEIENQEPSKGLASDRSMGVEQILGIQES